MELLRYRRILHGYVNKTCSYTSAENFGFLPVHFRTPQSSANCMNNNNKSLLCQQEIIFYTRPGTVTYNLQDNYITI